MFIESVAYSFHLLFTLHDCCSGSGYYQYLNSCSSTLTYLLTQSFILPIRKPWAVLHEDASMSMSFHFQAFLTIAWLALYVDPCFRQVFYDGVPLVLQCSSLPAKPSISTPNHLTFTCPLKHSSVIIASRKPPCPSQVECDEHLCSSMMANYYSYHVTILYLPVLMTVSQHLWAVWKKWPYLIYLGAPSHLQGDSTK